MKQKRQTLQYPHGQKHQIITRSKRSAGGKIWKEGRGAAAAAAAGRGYREAMGGRGDREDERKWE